LKVFFIFKYEHIPTKPFFNDEGKSLTTDVLGCKTIPKKLQTNIMSIKINDSFCIELHEYWNCTGRSIQMGNGSRQLNVLVDKGSERKMAVPGPTVLDWKISVGSVSPCGYKCNRSDSEGRESAGPEIVTVFDEPDFYGMSPNCNPSSGNTHVI